MKDLDFDELDRAVSSIMSGMSGAKSTQNTNAANNSQEGATAHDTAVQEKGPSGVSTPADLSVSPILTEGERPAPTSQVPTERKPPVAARRGRFMDVVRPGAAQQAEVIPRRVSRQGTMVEPARPLVTDIISSSAPSSTAKTPLTSDAPAPDKTEPSAVPAKTDWPDPIDMQGDFASGGEPLASPFLSNAKVEKRPLGSAATTPRVDTDTKKEDMLSDQREVNTQLTPNPTEVTTPLPEELSSDVMALESDANTIAMPAEDVKTEVARQVAEQKDTSVKPAEQVAAPAEASPQPKQEERESPFVAPEPVVPKGPISIPQQYREEPSTGDKENGSIYDTDTYHDQPLAHPKKKKSGWVWVVWIILILAVGAAGGAALYWSGVF